MNRRRCDFAFDEAAVLADSKLADPLVHLKVKQARLLTVELLPGVNVAVPIGESGAHSVSKPEINRVTRVPETTARDPLGVLVDAMWPHIRTRLDNYFAGMQRDEDPNPSLAVCLDESYNRRVLIRADSAADCCRRLG